MEKNQAYKWKELTITNPHLPNASINNLPTHIQSHFFSTPSHAPLPLDCFEVNPICIYLT